MKKITATIESDTAGTANIDANTLILLGKYLGLNVKLADENTGVDGLTDVNIRNKTGNHDSGHYEAVINDDIIATDGEGLLCGYYALGMAILALPGETLKTSILNTLFQDNKATIATLMSLTAEDIPGIQAQQRVIGVQLCNYLQSTTVKQRLAADIAAFAEEAGKNNADEAKKNNLEAIQCHLDALMKYQEQVMTTLDAAFKKIPETVQEKFLAIMRRADPEVGKTLNAIRALLWEAVAQEEIQALSKSIFGIAYSPGMTETEYWEKSRLQFDYFYLERIAEQLQKAQNKKAPVIPAQPPATDKDIDQALAQIEESGFLNNDLAFGCFLEKLTREQRDKVYWRLKDVLPTRIATTENAVDAMTYFSEAQWQTLSSQLDWTRILQQKDDNAMVDQLSKGCRLTFTEHDTGTVSTKAHLTVFLHDGTPSYRWLVQGRPEIFALKAPEDDEQKLKALRQDLRDFPMGGVFLTVHDPLPWLQGSIVDLLAVAIIKKEDGYYLGFCDKEHRYRQELILDSAWIENYSLDFDGNTPSQLPAEDVDSITHFIANRDRTDKNTFMAVCLTNKINALITAPPLSGQPLLSAPLTMTTLTQPMSQQEEEMRVLSRESKWLSLSCLNAIRRLIKEGDDFFTGDLPLHSDDVVQLLKNSEPLRHPFQDGTGTEEAQYDEDRFIRECLYDEREGRYGREAFSDKATVVRQLLSLTAARGHTEEIISVCPPDKRNEDIECIERELSWRIADKRENKIHDLEQYYIEPRLPTGIESYTAIKDELATLFRNDCSAYTTHQVLLTRGCPDNINGLAPGFYLYRDTPSDQPESILPNALSCINALVVHDSQRHEIVPLSGGFWLTRGEKDRCLAALQWDADTTTQILDPAIVSFIARQCKWKPGMTPMMQNILRTFHEEQQGSSRKRWYEKKNQQTEVWEKAQKTIVAVLREGDAQHKDDDLDERDRRARRYGRDRRIERFKMQIAERLKNPVGSANDADHMVCTATAHEGCELILMPRLLNPSIDAAPAAIVSGEAVALIQLETTNQYLVGFCNTRECELALMPEGSAPLHHNVLYLAWDSAQEEYQGYAHYLTSATEALCDNVMHARGYYLYKDSQGYVHAVVVHDEKTRETVNLGHAMGYHIDHIKAIGGIKWPDSAHNDPLVTYELSDEVVKLITSHCKHGPQGKLRYSCKDPQGREHTDEVIAWTTLREKGATQKPTSGDLASFIAIKAAILSVTAAAGHTHANGIYDEVEIEAAACFEGLTFNGGSYTGPNKAPILTALNKIIATHHGRHLDDWIGKKIKLCIAVDFARASQQALFALADNLVTLMQAQPFLFEAVAFENAHGNDEKDAVVSLGRRSSSTALLGAPDLERTAEQLQKTQPSVGDESLFWVKIIDLLFQPDSNPRDSLPFYRFLDRWMKSEGDEDDLLRDAKSGVTHIIGMSPTINDQDQGFDADLPDFILNNIKLRYKLRGFGFSLEVEKRIKEVIKARCVAIINELNKKVPLMPAQSPASNRSFSPWSDWSDLFKQAKRFFKDFFPQMAIIIMFGASPSRRDAFKDAIKSVSPSRIFEEDLFKLLDTDQCVTAFLGRLLAHFSEHPHLIAQTTFSVSGVALDPEKGANDQVLAAMQSIPYAKDLCLYHHERGQYVAYRLRKALLQQERRHGHNSLTTQPVVAPRSVEYVKQYLDLALNPEHPLSLTGISTQLLQTGSFLEPDQSLTDYLIALRDNTVLQEEPHDFTGQRFQQEHIDVLVAYLQSTAGFQGGVLQLSDDVLEIVSNQPQVLAGMLKKDQTRELVPYAWSLIKTPDDFTHVSQMIPDEQATALLKDLPGFVNQLYPPNTRRHFDQLSVFFPNDPQRRPSVLATFRHHSPYFIWSFIDTPDDFAKASRLTMDSPLSFTSQEDLRSLKSFMLGHDPAMRPTNRETLLHYAAQRPQDRDLLALIAVIFEKELDLPQFNVSRNGLVQAANQQNAVARTPLHIALTTDHLALANIVLNACPEKRHALIPDLWPLIDSQKPYPQETFFNVSAMIPDDEYRYFLESGYSKLANITSGWSYTDSPQHYLLAKMCEHGIFVPSGLEVSFSRAGDIVFYCRTQQALKISGFHAAVTLFIEKKKKTNVTDASVALESLRYYPHAVSRLIRIEDLMRQYALALGPLTEKPKKNTLYVWLDKDSLKCVYSINGVHTCSSAFSWNSDFVGYKKPENKNLSEFEPLKRQLCVLLEPVRSGRARWQGDGKHAGIFYETFYFLRCTSVKQSKALVSLISGERDLYEKLIEADNKRFKNFSAQYEKQLKWSSYITAKVSGAYNNENYFQDVFFEEDPSGNRKMQTCFDLHKELFLKDGRTHGVLEAVIHEQEQPIHEQWKQQEKRFIKAVQRLPRVKRDLVFEVMESNEQIQIEERVRYYNDLTFNPYATKAQEKEGIQRNIRFFQDYFSFNLPKRIYQDLLDRLDAYLPENSTKIAAVKTTVTSSIHSHHNERAKAFREDLQSTWEGADDQSPHEKYECIREKIKAQLAWWHKGVALHGSSKKAHEQPLKAKIYDGFFDILADFDLEITHEFFTHLLLNNEKLTDDDKRSFEAFRAQHSPEEPRLFKATFFEALIENNGFRDGYAHYMMRALGRPNPKELKKGVYFYNCEDDEKLYALVIHGEAETDEPNLNEFIEKHPNFKVNPPDGDEGGTFRAIPINSELNKFITSKCKHTPIEKESEEDTAELTRLLQAYLIADTKLLKVLPQTRQESLWENKSVLCAELVGMLVLLQPHLAVAGGAAFIVKHLIGISEQGALSPEDSPLKALTKVGSLSDEAQEVDFLRIGEIITHCKRQVGLTTTEDRIETINHAIPNAMVGEPTGLVVDWLTAQIHRQVTHAAASFTRLEKLVIAVHLRECLEAGYFRTTKADDITAFIRNASFLSVMAAFSDFNASSPLGFLLSLWSAVKNFSKNHPSAFYASVKGAVSALITPTPQKDCTLTNRRMKARVKIKGEYQEVVWCWAEHSVFSVPSQKHATIRTEPFTIKVGKTDPNTPISEAAEWEVAYLKACLQSKPGETISDIIPGVQATLTVGDVWLLDKDNKEEQLKSLEQAEPLESQTPYSPLKTQLKDHAQRINNLEEQLEQLKGTFQIPSPSAVEAARKKYEAAVASFDQFKAALETMETQGLLDSLQEIPDLCKEMQGLTTTLNDLAARLLLLEERVNWLEQQQKETKISQKGAQPFQIPYGPMKLTTHTEVLARNALTLCQHSSVYYLGFLGKSYDVRRVEITNKEQSTALFTQLDAYWKKNNGKSPEKVDPILPELRTLLNAFIRENDGIEATPGSEYSIAVLEAREEATQVKMAVIQSESEATNRKNEGPDLICVKGEDFAHQTQEESFNAREQQFGKAVKEDKQVIIVEGEGDDAEYRVGFKGVDGEYEESRDPLPKADPTDKVRNKMIEGAIKELKAHIKTYQSKPAKIDFALAWLLDEHITENGGVFNPGKFHSAALQHAKDNAALKQELKDKEGRLQKLEGKRNTTNSTDTGTSHGEPRGPKKTGGGCFSPFSIFASLKPTDPRPPQQDPVQSSSGRSPTSQ